MHSPRSYRGGATITQPPRTASPRVGTFSTSTTRSLSPRRTIKSSPKRHFTCCTENQPLINAYNELSTSVREFLALNSTNTLFGDFPEKFSQIAPLFESYCTQTTSILSMYNRSKGISTLMVSTIFAMKQILYEVYQSLQQIKEKGLSDHAKSINQNFSDVNLFLRQIKKETGKSTYKDVKTGGKAIPLQQKLADLQNMAIQILETNPGNAEAQSYSDEIMKYVRVINAFIDKDLTTIYPYKDAMKMRGMVTSWLATISELIISSQELPQQLKDIEEKFNRFLQFFNRINEQVGFKEEQVYVQPVQQEAQPQ